MWVVLFIVLLDIIGFGIILPIFPFFASRLGAGPELVMLFIALYMAAAFFSAPILGRLSDRHGRKPIIATSLIGAAVGYVILAFAESLLVIALSRILSGAMAGSFSAAQAYITDSTTEKERPKYMGLFGSAMALGYVIGPAIGAAYGGDSFETASFTGPALTAAALCLLALVLLVLFVKESAPPKKTSDAVMDRKQPQLLDSIRSVQARPVLALVVLCGLFYNLSSGLYESIVPLWAQQFQVIQGPKGLLPLLLASGTTFIVVQAALFAPLNAKFGNRLLISVGGVGLGLSCFAMTVAGSASSLMWATFAMMSTAFFAGIIMPSLQVLVANMAEEDERGLVLGVMGSVGSLGRTGATLLSGVLFAQLHFHAPYYAAILIAMILALVTLRLPKGV